MKIAGIAGLKPRYETVILGEDEEGRPVTVRMRAPRLGSIDRISAELQEPRPPVRNPPKTCRDPRTGEVLKDKQGRPLLEVDPSDPEHIRLVARMGVAQTFALVLECIDGEVEFDAKREDFEGPLEFYEAVIAEMENYGVDLAAMKRMSAAAARLSGVSPSELKEAAAALGAKRQRKG